jgi:peptide/nickel transport system permease protein
MTALVVVAVVGRFVLGAGVVSGWTGFTPFENHLPEKLSQPGENGYVLGSDANGRDILTRIAYGGRTSLTIALVATVVELTVGLGIGLLAGYRGGWVDSVLMRLVDVMLSIPTLPLLILVATLFTPGKYALALIFGAIYWPGDSRLIRGQTLALKNREYVEAARVVGNSPARIVLRHILPNTLPVLIVLTSLTIPGIIIAESALSFLGIGVQVPTPSWGNMLDEAARFYRTNPWNVVYPGLIVFVSALSLYLVGDGLRDAFDPKRAEQ